MTLFKRLAGLTGVLLTGVAFAGVPAEAREASGDAQRCNGLSSLVVDADTTVTKVTYITTPFETPRSEMGAPMPGRTVDKPFCRVEITARPGGSDIRTEIWLPASASWNGRFFGVGTGGFGGGILYSAPPTFAQGGLAGAMEKGYAAMATDYGHRSGGGELLWAIGNPQQLADFGYRAVHVATLGAKKVAAAFYGKAPEYSYWDGCSRGGAMGMVNAQRWFDDYDGIIAGNPARDWVRSLTSSTAYTLRQVRDPASRIPGTKRAAIHAEVMKQCDAADGLVDGLATSSGQCKFDAKQMLCEGADGDDCLTAPQADALNELYTGITDEKGDQIADPYMPGSEIFWPFLGATAFNNASPGSTGSVSQFWSGFVYGDANFDTGKSLDIEPAYAFAQKKLGWLLRYLDPDLSPLHRSGGKLLFYHGEADGLQSPAQTTEYYRDVVNTLGQDKADEFVRYYLLPGVGHCGGGTGPDVFDMLPALRNWVEKGIAPQSIVASKFDKDRKLIRTRPLCPYPQVATYSGSGDINDASNFSCRAPSR